VEDRALSQAIILVHSAERKFIFGVEVKLKCLMVSIQDESNNEIPNCFIAT
jgi:hypothetical protein